MRYLKSYKIFENNFEELSQGLKDIILEIEDLGLFVQFLPDEKNERIFANVSMDEQGRFTNRFKITQEIVDATARIAEYSARLGWSFCTFDVIISGTREYQLSGNDMEMFIGEDVWNISIKILDYRGPNYYKSRYGVNESLSDDRDHVESMMYDMEDLGYGYQIVPSVGRSMPSKGFKTNTIQISLYRKGQNSIMIDDIDYRIKQIRDIIGYELEHVIVRFALLNGRHTFDRRFQTLDDFSIKDGLSDTTLHEVEFQILEYGMNEWLEEFSYGGKQDGEYKFKSEIQFDDLEIYIDEKDIETDVRPVIREIEIKFTNEIPEKI